MLLRGLCCCQDTNEGRKHCYLHALSERKAPPPCLCARPGGSHEGFTNIFRKVVYGYRVFTDRDNERSGKGKSSAPTGDLARYYAILLTDIEKAYAFYMLYLYPHETDMPSEGEVE